MKYAFKFKKIPDGTFRMSEKLQYVSGDFQPTKSIERISKKLKFLKIHSQKICEVQLRVISVHILWKPQTYSKLGRIHRTYKLWRKR